MRIYIVGSSGSGKTTLARNISKETGIVSIDLDDIFYGKWKGDITDEKIKKFINELSESWIMEGAYVVKEFAAMSDRIIILRSNYLKTLYRQWKRYLTNQDVRLKYGLKNQFALSITTLREQYLGKLSGHKRDNYIFNKHNLDKILKDNKSKIIYK